MERVVAACGGDGTDDTQTRVPVEEVVADHESRPTPTLLVTRLRVEGEGNEVSLPRDINRHLPDLAADRIPPVELFRPVVLGDTPDEFTQIMAASHSAHRGHDEGPIAHRHIHRIPDVDFDIREQFLAQANSLTVAPLLDLRDHRVTSCGYP
jgi:hypothetical protein